MYEYSNKNYQIKYHDCLNETARENVMEIVSKYTKLVLKCLLTEYIFFLFSILDKIT